MTTTQPITDFGVKVELGAGGYDISVTLNGETRMIGFALRAKGGGYTLTALTLTQFPKALRAQAETLCWYGPGLTLTEVRKRAAVLAGIWLAGKTLDLASA